MFKLIIKLIVIAVGGSVLTDLASKSVIADYVANEASKESAK